MSAPPTDRARPARRPVRRGDVALAAAVALLSTVLVGGWLLSGEASAPDGGLQQIDLLSLRERVPGVNALEGRATMVVVTGQACTDRGAPRRLDERYGLVVSTDGALARRLALPLAARGCTPGYVLVDPEGLVRYRTYDPGWPDHAQEQEVLLEELAHRRHG